MLPSANRAGGWGRSCPASSALAAALAAFMLAFLVLPVFLACSGAFVQDHRFSLMWFGRILANRTLAGGLANSLVLSCVTTMACLLVAVPLAMVSGRCQFAGRGILGAMVLVPMILPPFVGALSLRRLFSQFGAVNQLLANMGLLDFSRSLPPDWLGAGFAGVVFLQTMHLFPILYLNASAALANVDPSCAQAARNLGAGSWRTFWKITLPLMRPGLFAGGTIVFIWAFTDVGTPLIVGYEHLTAVTIFKELARADTGGKTYALVFLMLGGSVTLYVLGKFVFGRWRAGQSTKASAAAETRRLGPLGTAGAWLLFGSVILLALLPHAGVVLTAIAREWVNTPLPGHYTLAHLAFVVKNPATYNSLLNSLKYAALSTCIDLVLGAAAAWLIVRSRVWGRTALDGLLMLPLAVPGLILAAGYVAMTATGPLAAFGPTRNPVWLLVTAYAVRRGPLAVRGISAALEQSPVELEEAARTLGSGPPGTVWRITLPLILANVVAAGVLTFAFAVLEVSDSLILAQTQQYYPITKQIYELAMSTGSPQTAYQAAALGVYGMFFLAATLAAAAILLGKKLGAMFRA